MANVDGIDKIGHHTQTGIKQFFLRYGLGFIINFAGTIVIARKGGPELWGLLAVCQLVLAIFAFLSLGSWGYLIQNPSKPTKREIGNCYSVQAVISAIWAGLVMVSAPLLSSYLSSEGLVVLLLGTVIGGFPYGWRYIACGISERELRYNVVAVAEVADIFTFNLIAVVFSLFGYPYYGILFGNLFRGVVSTVMAHISARQKIVLSYDPGIIKRILKFAFPFVGYNTLQWLPSNAGPVIAGTFLGVKELGLLQLSYKTVEYARVLVTIASRLSLSIFARLGDSLSEAQENTRKALDLMFFLLVPGIGLVVALSPAWITFIYGEEWSRMANVMVILAFPFLVIAMMTLICSLFSSQGKVNPPLVFFAIYNVIYWPVLIFLTMRVGYFGAPVTEWIVLVSCASLLMALKIAGFRISLILKYILKMLMLSLVMVSIWKVVALGHVWEALLLVIILLTLWVKVSPGGKEIVAWRRQSRARHVNHKRDS